MSKKISSNPAAESQSSHHQPHKQRAYIMTGATSGIGRAMAERILQDDDDAMIINLGRSTQEKVQAALLKEYNPEGPEGSSAHNPAQETFPNTVAGSRLQYRSVDFADDQSLDTELASVIQYVRENSMEVAGIIHCAGVAVVHNEKQPEADKKDQIELMYKVNRDAAIKIGKTFKDSDVLSEHARFGYVASLGAYKDRLPVPGLEQYGNSKQQAEAELKELYGEDYFTIYPGIYKTPMVDGFIKDLKTALEFYGIAAGEAVPHDKLMVETSNVIRGAKECEDVIYPVVPRWYVQLINEGRRNFLLPKFLKLFGKGILKMIGQGKEEHNARMAYHKENQSYGPDFPYDDLTYDKLLNESIGNSIAKVGRFLGLV